MRLFSVNLRSIALILICAAVIISCSDDESNSSKKKILSFKFTQALNEALTADMAATINETTKTITLQLPFDVDRDGLIPTIELSPGASVTPDTEVAHDFTAPVSYTVTAEDGSTVVYAVWVTNATSPLITSMVPTAGSFNMEVTINGSNFNPVKNLNGVRFNGVDAEVLSATATKLVVKVPAGASSGPVSLTVNGGTLTGPNFRYFEIFMVGIQTDAGLPPVIKVWKNGVESELPGSTNANATGLTVSGNDVYVPGYKFPAAGQTFSDIGFWKNDVFTKIGDSEDIQDISELVVSNGDVYVAGSYYDTPFNPEGNFRPYSVRYWKNGVMATPDQGDNVRGNVYALAVSGSDVYMGGFVADSEAEYSGYWKNNDFTQGLEGHYIRDIQIKGTDVHMVSSDATWVNNSVPITYIKNGVPQPITDNVFAMASGLAINGDDVYISGAQAFPAGLGFGAKIWKNGTGTPLFEDGIESNIVGVMVVDGHVFTAGQVLEDETYQAFYAIDGQVVMVTDETRSVTITGMFVR